MAASPDNAPSEPDFSGYMQHALQFHDYELAAAQDFCDELPDDIVDVHTHASPAEHFDLDRLTDAGRASMVSTYPVTTIEQSHELDKRLWPGANVSKLRFAHATNGHDQFAINDYLTERQEGDDAVALFGLSDTAEQIDATIAGLDSGIFRGLKMYYAAKRQHAYGHVYDYFPKPILAAAERNETPIILHLPNSLSQSVAEVAEVSEAFPGLHIMLAHAGVSFAYTPTVERSLGRLADNERVSVDTSGVTDAAVIAACIRQLGSDRVLFGSDEPFNLMRDITYVHPELGPRLLTDIEYHWVIPEERREFLHLRDPQSPNNHIQQLQAIMQAVRPLSDRVREQLFAGNARRLFGIGADR